MLRILARFLGLAALAAAMAAGVYDGARSIADATPKLVSIGEATNRLAPRLLPLLEDAVTRNIHPLLWNPLAMTLLMAPATIALFALGVALLLAAAAKPPPVRAPD